MSVIVRLPDGGIKCYCKGADSRVFAVLAQDNDPQLLSVTHQHLGQFSKKGLRTLAVAYKDLSEAEFQAFNVEWMKASNSTGDRDA
jgi:magnesium-transporting ATPase (P-type)